MTTPAPRRTSLALVVVPGLVLALLGARAVVTEADAAEGRARDRARAAAGRLARSVTGMVAEFEEALPIAGGLPRTLARVSEALDYLDPNWIVDGRGRLLEPRAADPEPRTEENLALEHDALTRAAEIREGEGGPLTAAALLAGVSEVIGHPEGVASLRLAAARYAAEGGRPEDALADLEIAADAARRAAPGAQRDLFPRVLGSAAENVAMLPSDAPAPAWVGDVFVRIAADPWGLEDALRTGVLDGVARILGDRLPAGAAERRALWDGVRELARRPEPPRATVDADGERVVVRVYGRLEVTLPEGNVLVLVGGAVPERTVTERLHREALALVRDGGADAVRLLSPEGRAVLDARTGTPSDEGAPQREAVELDAPLAGWRVEAEVHGPAGIPATALLLALAGIATTVALLAGAVALQRAADRQAALAEDRKRFLDHVAHEIRTPASALLSLAEELEAGHVAPDREQLYREHLATEARRLAELVDDTLDLTRLETGRLRFRRVKVDLRDLVRTAVEASRTRTAARGDEGPEVRVTLPEVPVPVVADRAAIVRTMRNLVDNAVQHGGGDEAVEVTLTPDRRSARIAVRDHGRGIAPEHVPHLFDRFYRVPGATHEVKGVGLGLSLCLAVVQAHGGRLDVRSEPGRGSTFTLDLPLEDVDAA